MKKHAYLFFMLVTIITVLINLFSATNDKESPAIISEPEIIEEEPVSLSQDTSKEYKIAYAYGDLAYEIVSSEDTLEKAKELVSVIPNDDLIIIRDGTIEYVKYGLLDLNVKNSTLYTLFYVDDKENYLNGSLSTDALFIDTLEDHYELKVSNARGLVLKQEAKIVPLAYVKSPSYYFLNSYNELVHAISTDIYEEDAYTYTGTIDKAPDYLKQGEKYYSYDGIYFYQSINDLTKDERENSTKRAINDGNPFYAYYLYLPVRNISSYTASDINRFLKYKLDSIGATNKSVLLNSGQYFINAETNFKVNAIIELAWAIHESGYGTSSIAINKYNLFGLNATDNNPYGNASGFYSVQSGVNYHANTYVNEIYLNTSYYRYSGDYVGNKGGGFNVFYASDPYWGEKIAAIYYQIDKYLGFKDYGKYSDNM